VITSNIALRKTGAGIQTLSYPTFYSGGTTIDRGTLAANAPLVASFSSTNGTTTGASANVTIDTTTGLYAGQPVSGTGIPAGAFIVSINSPTQFTLSANATAASPTLTFGAGSALGTGPVTVNPGGTLSGTGGVGDVTLAAASGTNVARVAPGVTGATGNVGTLKMSSLTSNGGDLKVDLVGSSNDLIQVTGTATFPAGTTTTISPNASAKANTYTILTAGTLSIDPTATLSLNVPSDPTARPATFTLITDPNALKLKVEGGAKSITWTGANGTEWDINTTANWKDDAPPNVVEKYFNGDTVTFGNTAPNRNITLNTLVLPGDVVVANSAGNDYTISGSGSITGGGKLIKQGAGTLVLLNNNSYSGLTSVEGGTVQAGNGGTSGSIGSGGVNLAGGTKLVFQRSDNISVSNPISGAGSIEQKGPGVLTLGGANSYSGGTTASAGTLRAGNQGAFGTAGASVLISPGATLDVNGQNLTAYVVTASGTGVAGAAIVNNGPDQNNALLKLTLAGNTVVGGTGRFDLRGTGAELKSNGQPYTLTKIGANQFSLADTTVDPALGDVNVNEGLLRLEGTTSGLGNTGKTLTLANGTILELVSLSGGLDKPIASNGGRIRAANGTGNTISGPVTLSGPSVFEATGANALTFTGVVGGAGGVTKENTGTVNLSNPANTYQGPTVINGGTLGVDVLANGGLPSGIGQSSSAPANLVFNGGTLRYGGTSPSSTDRQFTLGGNATFNSSGVGVVTFTNPAPAALTGTGNILVTLNGDNKGDNTIAAALGDRPGGATSLLKDGDGTWVLTGANPYSGTTSVSAGTLRVGGSLPNSAVSVAANAKYEVGATQTVKSMALADGSYLTILPGQKSLKTNLTLSPFALVDLNDGGIAMDYSGGATPYDAARSAIISGYNGGGWNGFGIMSTTAQTNPAAGVGYGEAGEIMGAGGGTFMGQGVDGDTLLVRYTLKGDASLDGKVDFTDLVALAQNYNTMTGTVPWNKGDFNYDGNVDFADLVALAQNYNQSLPSAAQIGALGASAEFGEDLARAFAQVPEPGSASLLAVAALAMCRGRRRRRA
jgi:fibronectin-binding autotransporter adhesin